MTTLRQKAQSAGLLVLNDVKQTGYFTVQGDSSELQAFADLVKAEALSQQGEQYNLAHRLRVHLANGDVLTGPEFRKGVVDILAEYYAGTAPAAQPVLGEQKPKFISIGGRLYDMSQSTPQPDARKVIEKLLYCVEAWERGCLREDYSRDRDDAITEGQKWLEENK